MGYVVKHTTTGVNNARRKGNVALGVDADGYDKTSVSGFYAGVAPVPGFHNLVRTSASDDPDFYTLTDLELVNFANSLGGSVTDVTGAKVYLASRNDVMFTDDIPDDTEVDGLILELDASKLSSYPESGNTWYDLSGNGNNGTLTNGPTFNSNGYLEFDGGNDYVLGIGSLGISGNASFSISYFARWDGSTFSTNYPSGVGNNTTGATNRGLSTTWRQGRIALDFWVNRFRANTALSVQKWYHVAFTKSPGLIGSTSKLYVNGQEVPGSTEGTNTTPNITDSSWVVGRLDSTRWFDGQVSQVQIYNQTLSPQEINQNYYQASIITDNLYAAFDPNNLVSYESGSNVIYNLADPTDSTSDGVVNSTVEVSLDGNLKFGGDGSLVSSNRNTYVEYTNVSPTGSFDLPGWDGYSIGIWAKRTKYGTWNSGITHYDGIWNYYWNHNLYFSGAHTGLNQIQGTGLSGYNIDMNEWYYIVTTHDNNAASNNHKVYINGELEQTSHQSNPTYTNGEPRRFYIGNWDSGWAMVGEVGAYHIYDQAITADEVLQNYNTYKSRYQNQDPTLEIDGDWLKVFRHYSGDGDFFSSSNDWAEAKSTNTDNPQANKYSILDTLYRYKLDDKFTFKIVYPSQSLENPAYSNVTNIWSQTNNPVRDDGLGGVTGYTAIDIDSAGSGWGGLERYDAQSATFLDGTLIPQGNWWWAIGSKNAYDGGNPNFPGPGYTTRLVELWVKYK